MRVFITGANGFVGASLSRRLFSEGNEVFRLVRKRQANSENAAGPSEHECVGDITDASAYSSALEKCDVVFHLAGVRRAISREEFMRTNAEGTRVLAQEMVKRGAKRLVLCGSLAAMGPSTDGRPRVESDPFRPHELYGESKAEAERIAFSFKDTLEVTCLRPARIVGPLDRENLTFFKLVKRGIVLQLTGAPRKVSMVDVEDVVDALICAGSHPAAVNESFFVASGEAWTVEELMRDIASEMGVKARTVPLSPSILNTVAAVCDGISAVTGKRLPLNRKLARQLLAPGWTCDVSKAKRVLGFEAKTSIAASVKRSLQSYLEAGWL